MNQLKLIDEREVLGKSFKIYGTPEEPLFLAKDVAEWIEYDKSSINKLVNKVEDDEKVRKIVPTLGGEQEMWLLTEDGLYEVLMQSRKPIAKKFKKKVKHILKDIRKQGIYATNDMIEKMLNDPDTMITALKKLKTEREKVAVLTEKVEEQDKKLQLFRNLQRLNEMLRASDIGMYYGITAKEFNRIMQDAGVIKKVDNNFYGRNSYYVMTAKYSHTRYCQVITDTLKNGVKIKTNVWLPESLEFIDSIMQEYGYEFDI
ncbi:BRO-N domain-containing protein [Paramaledivibacter caminithermalis]|uniref:Prophage antirepressor n=1 Tax=Paramaledivibacter caminithermalis (strain DSM 15212 / CIP 107654 / DViRD3) TaxID=1121301 RepID=A0A1M6M1Z7_PARC5|nr:BRO family protein [Paramaledivibacter caminithermalis]SHJ77390.1 Prophage antirepressor [Paramaledivibacter caminithermalis DSM 15212]